MAGWNANPVAVFAGQVAAIIMLTLALWFVGIAIVLSFARVFVWLDQDGIAPGLIAFVVPLCLGWWLYAKALRRFVSRLDLAVPLGVLGVPLVGEGYVIAAVISRR